MQVASAGIENEVDTAGLVSICSFTMKKLQRAVFLLLPLSASPLAAQAPLPVGGFFQINTYTTGFQQWAAPAMTPAGDFVVVWEETYGQDGDTAGIFGQRFAGGGAALGAEFQVNTYTTGGQRDVAVAMAPDGGFVVVWDDLLNQTGDYGGVFGQRYAADGSPRGEEFRVNLGSNTDARSAPAVDVAADGSFPVVWSGFSAVDQRGVLGRRFSALGEPVGEEFQVNAFTSGDQAAPAVVVTAGGELIAVWTSAFQDGSVESVFGQRLAPDGAPRGAEFRVNTYTTGRQRRPHLAAASDGEFIVIWNSYDGQDGSESGVFGQRFAAGGAPLGGELQINAYTTAHQLRPKIAATHGDEFVVVWQSFGAQNDVFGRRLAADGSSIGGEFLINSYTPGHQQNARVAAAPDGRFVVVWSSYGLDGSAGGLFGQRFQVALFADGFESGDVSAWSTTRPR